MGEPADDLADAASDLWDDLEEGSKQIAEFLGYDAVGIQSKKTKRARRAALEASRPRRPANIDDARVRQQEGDRLRRRQGVLANIYGGEGAAPAVGTKVLLGS